MTPAEIERAAAAAWPAAEAVERDGWLLRATPGVPHRRNGSALPLAPDGDLGPVRAFYAARGLPALVQLAPEDAHPAPAAALDAEGWAAEGATDVLVAAAERGGAAERVVAGHQGRGGRRAGGASGAGVAGLAVTRLPLRDWLEAAAAAEPSAHREAVAREVLSRSAGEVVALAAGREGIALCIVQPGLSGIFSLAVHPRARRRGIATSLLRAAAEAAGPGPLYAQVERDNAAAQALYAQAGFTRSHGYHYRRAPG